jgi:diaminopropionate ammonia-lyase
VIIQSEGRIMMQLVKYNRNNKSKMDIGFLSIDKAVKVKKFHESIPGYRETPLRSLDNLAREFGVSKIFVKDESFRFGLNSFKSLGGSYAIGSCLGDMLRIIPDELTFDKLTSDRAKSILGDMTFVTATDGNHGRGVAWTAKMLGHKSVVYMPQGSSLERLRNIQSEGAEASITDMNYDEAVCLASEMAEKNGWILIQDTAWEGYEDIPVRIMQGYGTMALEAYMELLAMSEKPTHIFLQAGVGSMAAAVTGFFANVYGDDWPITVIVEPEKANCVFRTARADDGKIHTVTGNMDTIMAGLACGVPSTLGWEILRDYADGFISCPDSFAAQGMRILGCPLEGDLRIVSGESGAAGFGATSEILRKKEHMKIKESLNLDENSKILFFSTEGSTDAENYKKIVWDAEFGIK